MDTIRIRDLTNQHFGELVVTSRAENLKDRVAWNCLCSCGNTKAVRASDLTSGHTKTCGHNTGHDNIIRGEDKFLNGRIVRTYHNMKQRCFNPKSTLYVHYGARGIKVCNEWLGDKGLENFYKWSIENGYDDKLTIDRIDVNKGYSPKNCRWATKEVQDNNKTNSKYITICGQRKTISQWERELNVPKGLLRRMIQNESIGQKLLKIISKITYDGSTLKIEISI